MKHTYDKKLAWCFTLSALALATTACTSGKDHQSYTALSGDANSRIERALANQGDLTTFHQALISTGVVSELNNNTEYTIFAPTNAAFAQIRPHLYPCFYTVQCRTQVAAVLRNHIVPRNESINRFSKQGGDIKTLGNRRIDVEEPYAGHYTVEGLRVLYQNNYNQGSHAKGNKVTIYQIDGVIANNQDMAPFRVSPFTAMPASITERTITTYRTPTSSYPLQNTLPNMPLVPGGYTSYPIIYANEYEPLTDSTTETTTITHTTEIK